MDIVNFKIRKYRKQFNLRQEDLATKLNLSTQLIRMYENGTRNPSLDTKRNICKLFNISLNEIEGLTDREMLKIELENKLHTLKLSEKELKETKTEILDNFYRIFNKSLDLKDVISKEYSPKNVLQNCIIDFILKNYICESILTDTIYNENILYNSLENFSSSLTNFIISNIRFIESAIEELKYFKEDLKLRMIPVVSNVIDNWILLTKSTREYMEIPNSLQNKNKKLFGYKITNDEMAMKYEIGNIAICEWTNTFSDNDDVILYINNVSKFRRIEITKSGIVIKALNQLFGTEFYTKEDMDKLNIKIIGKVIGIKLKN